MDMAGESGAPVADMSLFFLSFSQAYELSTLTGTQVLLLVASETGHVYTFATPKLQPIITRPEGKHLIQSCLNAPDEDPYAGDEPAQNDKEYPPAPAPTQKASTHEAQSGYYPSGYDPAHYPSYPTRGSVNAPQYHDVAHHTGGHPSGAPHHPAHHSQPPIPTPAASGGGGGGTAAHAHPHSHPSTSAHQHPHAQPSQTQPPPPVQAPQALQHAHPHAHQHGRPSGHPSYAYGEPQQSGGGDMPAYAHQPRAQHTHTGGPAAVQEEAGTSYPPGYQWNKGMQEHFQERGHLQHRHQHMGHSDQDGS
eukprot:TRINITY_DN938_c0_g1_i2.p1 TRINITY_DN938_c0_g1~~TRINITY_DN938_c0_g1_i2.p1  ORF type:complete len:306 (+),score=63.09 TRINITY_DN938_c0_g1_i2:194-1111(+)